MLAKVDLPFVHAKVAYMYGWKHRLVMTASNLSNFSERKSILVAPGKPFGENGNRYVKSHWR